MGGGNPNLIGLDRTRVLSSLNDEVNESLNQYPLTESSVDDRKDYKHIQIDASLYMAPNDMAP